MKLFLKEHILLIFIQCLQLFMLIFIFWLDGYKNYQVMLYALFLGLFFLSCYLIYRFVTQRKFYYTLQGRLDSLDQSLQEIGKTPVAGALQQLLQSQYKLYQEKIHDIENKKEEHLAFIDRWVHQMKTPLSVIELTAQNLDEPDSSSIREETERIKIGLQTVLYMARLRTIEADFQIKPVALGKLVHEVNQENKRFYIRNDVYPKFEMKTENTMVETDEKWVFFILTQLIQNAVKYSAGKSKQINLSIYKKENSTVLEVKDFGIGIPITDHKRIYQAFYTGDNGRTYRESTGMGLYIVKEVADYLGHKLEMESEVNKGTTFRIIF